MNIDGSPEASVEVDLDQSRTSSQTGELFKRSSEGSIILTSVPVHLFVCGVRLTPALDGSVTESLLEHSEHVGHGLHHHTVKGAGDQIVHETEEATGPRRVGFIKTFVPKVHPQRSGSVQR